MLKSLEELSALRNKVKGGMSLRHDNAEDIKVAVAMATCGIEAGARPVLAAFVGEVAKRGLSHVTVTQSGCLGVCSLEPIVEVMSPGKEKVTYVRMTPERAARVVEEHLVGKKVVAEYTIGAAN